MPRIGLVLALAAVVGLTARVQVARALDCEPAGRALAVRASIAGTDRLTVSPFTAGGGSRCWWGQVEPAAPPAR